MKKNPRWASTSLKKTSWWRASLTGVTDSASLPPAGSPEKALAPPGKRLARSISPGGASLVLLLVGATGSQRAFHGR